MIRALFVSTVLIAGLLASYSTLIEPRRLVVKDLRLHNGDDVIRIALVSDLHIGGFHTSADRIRSLVARVNEEAPDLILIPGDFISGSTPRPQLMPEKRAKIENGIAELSALQAPVFATIGNHDAWHDAPAVAAMLEELGIRVLDNESSTWKSFCIVGLADSDTDIPTSEGFKDCEKDQRIIAMMHSPDARELVPSSVELAVAGHTHGGQINLPLIGRRVTATHCGEPCAYGWIDSNAPFYVTSGIGTSILPIRFRSPPELVLFNLPATVENEAPL